MNTSLAMVLALLIAAVIMFVINRPRMDAVGLLVMTLLPFTGVVTIGETLAGFSDPNIVLIAMLFVIGDGLVRTGVAQRLGDWLTATAGSSETKLIALLMVVTASLGSMMSSTAVTAIFIPVALRIAARTGAAPGQLLMPLSSAALISGMLTLVATAPNLVVNSELTRQGHEGFGFFAFTPFGVPILVLGIIYMLFARRLLPKEKPGKDGDSFGQPSLSDWIQKYRLADRERRYRVGSDSPLIGRRLKEVEVLGAASVNIIAIERAGRLSRELLRASAETQLRDGDIVIVDVVSAEAARAIDLSGFAQLPLADAPFSDLTQEIGMAEVIVPADSHLIGRTVCQVDFRTRTGLTVIGLQHGSTPAEGAVADTPISLGDTLLVTGRWADIKRIRPEESGVLLLRLPTEVKEMLPVVGRTWHAVAALGVVMVLMITGLVPNVQAALIGCMLMGLFGCVTLESAYRAINWKTLILIVGMLPFSLALKRTGGIDLAADALASLTSGADPRIILACIFVITAMLGMFISNTATAVLMAPVALAIAAQIGASPYPFAMIVALAASTAFMTPVSSPVNTLVVTPGRYTFADFVKVGVPFSLVVMVVCVVLVPMLLPVCPD